MLLKIERKGYHLRVSFGDGVSVNQHILVAHLLGVFGVKTVAETIHELQFGTQFEERKIEIASYAHFQEYVGAF